MKRFTTLLTLAILWLLLGGLAQAGTPHYYYTDPQGTPLVKADASGNVIARYDYAPYGTSVASLGNPPNGPGYTGHVNDPETGLVYMQARYYDPALGRFLSIDPVAPSAGNTFNFNRYVYVNNNPLVRIDSDGKQASDPSMTAPCGDCVRPPPAVLNGAAQVLDFVDEATTAYPGAGLEHAAAVPMIATLKEAAVAAKVARVTKTAAQGAEAEAKVITLSRALHGEAAEHAADAIAAGKPSMLTVDRAGAAANRKASIGALDKVPGKHLDEYPPAMFKEGGAGASVRAISPRDNMSAGACIGNACRGVPDGTHVKITVGE